MKRFKVDFEAVLLAVFLHSLFCWTVMYCESDQSVSAIRKNAVKPIPPVRFRSGIPHILQNEGFTTGAELGVQTGRFSREILSVWTNCTRFYLVDCWRHQKNYNDTANFDQGVQDKLYTQTVTTLKPFEHKLVYLRNYTVDAAKLIANDSLDFIYIDARHDYCGVKEDLTLYWPKVRSGGIVAGHDFLTASEVQGQDWSVCMNGEKHPGAVKGAVVEFAEKYALQIYVTYGDHHWSSWIMRKP